MEGVWAIPSGASTARSPKASGAQCHRAAEKKRREFDVKSVATDGKDGWLMSDREECRKRKRF
jgi:hypothetical protein